MKASKKRFILLILVLLSGIFWFSLPSDLFDDPHSTAVYDRYGELLGARIADDGQWRFPGLDSVPDKYSQSVILFEDRYFKYHPGINPVSMFRALVNNIRAGKVVSGGSTISMQVMRMSRKNKPRNIPQKMIESLLSLRYELGATKEEILRDYSNNAPFGGNVVGLEAAAWRYFGTSPYNLTWSESALLAVLPNAPSMIHPGKNRDLLRQKRNTLLDKLYSIGKIDALTLELAKEEPLPGAPLPLPDLSPHLTDRTMLRNEIETLHSTIDAKLQRRADELLNIRQEILRANQINNMACVIVEVSSGEVLAYVGNSRDPGNGNDGNDVDIIPSERSSGSILKPFLFAGMLDNGDLLQTSLVPDVPIRYSGYAPKNYDRGYSGAVPAFEALERSLNIPAVILLNRYGIEPFLGLLRNLGFTTFRYDHQHYGLTLILGGAEVTLWELAGVYASMARTLVNYTEGNGNYFPSDLHMPKLIMEDIDQSTSALQEEGILSASSIYLTFQSLLEVNRPEELSLWYLMDSKNKIAWKTGTSYGFRDAWAVGVTPEYVVAVWAGNADGEGRPGLSGITAAAPLMFDLFSILPETSWFESPLDDLAEGIICIESGYLAGPHCPNRDTIQVVPVGARSEACPYHRMIHLDKNEEYRVNSVCYPVTDMVSRSWFILPPLMEWYYRSGNPSYRSLPAVMDGCVDKSVSELEIVYPQRNSNLVIPRELDGTKGKVVMEIAHRESGMKVFWHVDDQYVGTTNLVHQLALDIEPGNHRLTVVDENGNSESVSFRVLK